MAARAIAEQAPIGSDAEAKKGGVVDLVGNRWRWLSSPRTSRLIAAALICAVTFGYFRFKPGVTKAPEVNREAIRRALHPDSLVNIKTGMTKQEVVRLIGGPSGSYNRYPVVWRLGPDSWESVFYDCYKTETWTGDEGELTVCFDDKGIVHGAFFHPIDCDSRTLFQRLFDWLRSKLP